MGTAAELDQTTDEGSAARTSSLPFAAALVVVVLVVATKHALANAEPSVVLAVALVVTPVLVEVDVSRGGTVARAAERPAEATGVPRLTARAYGARSAAWHDGRSPARARRGQALVAAQGRGHAGPEPPCAASGVGRIFRSAAGPGRAEAWPRRAGGRPRATEPPRGGVERRGQGIRAA